MIKFAFVSISAGFMVSKTTFNRNYGIIIPVKYDAPRMPNIRTKSSIATRILFPHIKFLSFVLDHGRSLYIQYKEKRWVMATETLESGDLT